MRGRRSNRPYRKGILMVRILRIFVVMALLFAVATPALAKGHNAVPIKGTVMGEHGRFMFDPACAPEEPQPEDVWWRFSSIGVGQVSHLGTVEYFLTQCTMPGPDGFESAGTIKFTAANNDELEFEHTMLSQLEPPTEPPLGFTFEGEWVAVGGTGRFAGATGHGLLAGVGDVPDGVPTLGLPDGLMRVDFTGMIDYDASNRSSK